MALAAGACSPAQAPRPHLAAAYGDYRKVDNTLTFELPDTGGYLVNGVALDTANLQQLLHDVFDHRLPYLRAGFVVDNPRRPWSDVDVLYRTAQAAGVQLFDAASSGRLPLKGWQVISRDTVR